jgi:plasmid maintenance system killer protein
MKFHNADTESLFSGLRSGRFQAIEKIALRKLFQLHAARSLHHLN